MNADLTRNQQEQYKGLQPFLFIKHEHIIKSSRLLQKPINNLRVTSLKSL